MIDLSLVSPSSVGQYAACSQRLVWDSAYPKRRGSSSAADFGTVCHWTAMTLLGCGPLDPPEPHVLECAATRFSSIEEMAEQADRCATFANTKLPQLATGVTWIAERKVHDPSLLPERLNRRGEKKGYGGSIDLLTSDNTHIVDYKFVGELPDYVKIEYVWQMGSYSFLKDVPLTTILFVTRDALQSTKLTIDWRVPKFAEYRNAMRTFIHRTGLIDFERYAYPTAGHHCDWCDHKARCGASRDSMPVFEFDVPHAPPRTNFNAIDEMRKQLALHKGMSQPTPEQAMAPVSEPPKAQATKAMLDASPAAKNNLF